MKKLAAWILVWALLVTGGGFPPRAMPAPGSTPPRQPTVAIGVVHPDCPNYGGPYPCYPSLAAWEADYGGIDFGAHPPGELVAADKVAVAQIEGLWTEPDSTPLEISGWVTDPTHYIHIVTTPASRHHGVAGTGYRLETTDPAIRPLYSDVAYLHVEGLEIYSHSAYDSHVIYLRPDTDSGVGEIRLSHNLIHGDAAHSASGILNYDCRGLFLAWNNIIYDVGTPGYTAGIQTAAGTAYLYNNTIVAISSGFAIRSGGVVVAKNNLTDAPGDDFYGSFYLGSDFNASTDDSAPGPHARRNQTFAFLDYPNRDFHLAPEDQGARNHGQDLSGDAFLPLADDIDGVLRSGGWDIGADEESTPQDDVPPVRWNGRPTGVLPATTTTATLSLQTNEAATCRYSTTAGLAYDDMPAAFSTTTGLSHTTIITGLHDEQAYSYYSRCRDAFAATNTGDYTITFYVASSDAVPPVISAVQAVRVSPYTADITWATDEPATSQVEYGLTDAYGAFTVISTGRVLSHTVALAGLEPTTTYHFRVRSRDVADNETVSAGYTLTTAARDQFRYVDQNHPLASDTNPGTADLPWATIQHAADVAQPGDTIIVSPGTYTRTHIPAGGAPGQYITFQGATVPDQGLVDPDALFDPANPVQVPGNPALNAVTRGFVLDPPYGVITPVAYVRLQNFEITDIHEEAVSGQGGIMLQGTAHVEIVGNFLHDLNPDPASYGYIGIRGSSHDNVAIVVKGNTLYRVQGTGINVMGRDWLVEDNELSHGLDTNTDTGAHVGGDSDAMRFFGSGHAIRHNYAHDYLDEEQYGDPHIDCFQTFSVYPESQFAYDILVEGNLCDNLGQMLMIEDSSEQNGTGNVVHHITFRNNIFLNARAVGINGSYADHFVLANNVFANGHYAGIGLSENPYLTVVNNIFYHNGGGSQIIDEQSKVGSVWDYNLHDPDFTWPPKQPEFDQHSLFGVDPGFAAPALGAFHLRVNAPAVDRGIPVTGFNYDRDMVRRPQGAGWDIGAYETLWRICLPLVRKAW